MDIVRLNSSTYLPNADLDGFFSAIWTERYITYGDFEFKTYEVDKYLGLLDEMSLVSHRETDEVMYVESMLVEIDDDDQETLTIKGKSVSAFFDERYFLGDSQKKYAVPGTHTVPQFLSLVLWNAFVNTSTIDVTRTSGVRSVYDSIPNLTVSNMVDPGVNAGGKWWVSGGSIAPRIAEIQKAYLMGIRTCRPPTASSQSVRVSTDGQGTISYVNRTNDASMILQIYKGVDHRLGTTHAVIFGGDFGGLENPSFYKSVEGYKTNAYLYTPSTKLTISRPDTLDAELRGFQRRGLWIDGGQPDEGESVEDFAADLPDYGLTVLKTYNQTTLSDGGVSENSQYKYKRDYNLGDRVTLYGALRTTQDVRVSEYIRTDDSEGDRGYPTLVTSFD